VSLRWLRCIAGLLALPILGAGCATDPHWYFSGADHEHHAAWSYAGDTGPEHWGALDPSYRLAETGRAQSPIDIRAASAIPAPPPQIRFRYAAEPATYVNNGHTLQHDQAPGSWLEVDGQCYALKQFHVHTPSEHTFDGVHLDAEIHLVHADAAGNVAVVGVLVRSGAKNPAFASVHGTLPREGQTKTLTGRIDPGAMLPESRRTYRYTGSFTTPPCTENVEWFVLEQPIEAAPEEIAGVHALEGNNARPTQPLNGRLVHVVEP
jgi:carbonic anhydrase